MNNQQNLLYFKKELPTVVDYVIINFFRKTVFNFFYKFYGKKYF